MENAHHLHHGVIVLERLAHAHHDDVAQRPAELARLARGLDHLADHLTGGQVARQAHHAGGAEGAADRAADLARDADGRSVRVEHEDRFEMLAIEGAEEELARFTVVGLDRAHQFEPGHLQPIRKLGAQ